MYEGNRPADSDNFEALRSILEQEQQRPVSLEEATEFGQSLVSYFELLAKIEEQVEGSEVLAVQR